MNTTLLVVITGISTTVLFFLLLMGLQSGALWQKRQVEEASQQTLVDLFIFIDTRRLMLINLIVFLLLPTFAWLLTGSPFLVVIAAVAALFLPRAWVVRLRRKRLKLFARQMPDGLLMLASSLQAGMGLGSALEILAKEQPAPFSQEIGLLLRTQRMGVSFEDALSRLEIRLPIEEFRLFTVALRIARSVGGNLSETLETLAHTLSRKAEVEGKIASLTAQGRMQAWVMTGLPIGLILVLRVMEPG
ncbi:MAG: type II secretion system F family protein, partial [Acidithiobacillus sp.]